jgi:hypothetical protein
MKKFRGGWILAIAPQSLLSKNGKFHLRQVGT